MGWRERYDDVRHRRHRRPNLGRAELIRELLEIIELLIAETHRRRIVVTVQMPATEQVTLHAVEENAEGQPIDKDTASCVWTADRLDLLVLNAAGFDVTCVPTAPDAVGDTIVTATVTEPDVTNDDGSTSPGQVYVGTQLVSLTQDTTISQVEVTADAPVPIEAAPAQ